MNLRTMFSMLTLLAVTAVSLVALTSAPVQTADEAALEMARNKPKFTPGKPLKPLR